MRAVMLQSHRNDSLFIFIAFIFHIAVYCDIFVKENAFKERISILIEEILSCSTMLGANGNFQGSRYSPSLTGIITSSLCRYEITM